MQSEAMQLCCTKPLTAAQNCAQACNVPHLLSLTLPTIYDYSHHHSTATRTPLPRANKKVRVSSELSRLVVPRVFAHGKRWVCLCSSLPVSGTWLHWMLKRWIRAESRVQIFYKLREERSTKKWCDLEDVLTALSEEQERGLRAPWSSPLHHLSRNDISCHLCYASFYISLIIPPPGECSYVTGQHRELHLKPGRTATQDGATQLAAPPAQRETKAQPEPRHLPVQPQIGSQKQRRGRARSCSLLLLF